jgi:hypothetical protein
MNKDYFIRDFEDFYFKTRPKLASRLVHILLVVITINKNNGMYLGRYKSLGLGTSHTDE